METILLDIITNIITGTIIITSQIKFYKLLNKIDKIKLIKKNKFQNFKVIESPPIIRKTRSKKESNINKNKEIEQIVSTFMFTLKLYITDEEMKTIEKNLKTLQYKKGNPLFFKLTNSCGYYSIKKHYIAVAQNKEIDKYTFNHIIYHELLHAITSSYNKNTYYCGFKQTNKKNYKQIGNLLNEGYTELLTRRMLACNDKVGYEYEVAIAKMIEFIIGKEKMQKLFFSCDLNGLITELSKYQNINKVKQFILNLDTIYALYNSKNLYERKTLATLYNEVSIFLYESFQNKMEQTINIHNIESYEFISKRFQELFNETTRHTFFRLEAKNILINNIEKEEIKSEKEYIKAIKQHNREQKRRSKQLIKRRTNNKGYINILTITTTLTIISLLSIGISYLLLQAR